MTMYLFLSLFIVFLIIFRFIGSRNVYNSKIALLFAPRGEKKWAVVLGQIAFYSIPENEVTITWRRHEECHKMQWKREGYIKFLITYIYFHFKFGYENNPYELEAIKNEIII